MTRILTPESKLRATDGSGARSSVPLNVASGGSLSSARTGRSTVKVAPCPSPALSAETEPPCSSTKWRTMAKPKPKPPIFAGRRAVDLPKTLEDEGQMFGRNA